MFQTKIVEKIESYILCSVTLFENRAAYEIMFKNFVEPDRPLLTIWRIRIARWVPKVTNTPSHYVILTAFPIQQWLQELASMLSYTNLACLVSL